MASPIPAFKIKVKGRALDYRLGRALNLKEVINFFSRRYKVKKIWSGGRHILGFLDRSNRQYFLKLATTMGISAVTENEYKWNNIFNSNVSRKSGYWVPKNYEAGNWKKLFYFICEKFDGNLMVDRPKPQKNQNNLINYFPKIIEFSEIIQALKLQPFNNDFDLNNSQENFVSKTKGWYQSIPKSIKEKYQIEPLLKLVEKNAHLLLTKTRHGDFTPWHIFKLNDRVLGLIDAEHAMAMSVENYDIGYFIQRIFSVLQDEGLAGHLFKLLIKRGYKTEKLKTILLSRAIGGFLDESLTENPNYIYHVKFKSWVLKIG